jgi:hypothetical protein
MIKKIVIEKERKKNDSKINVNEKNVVKHSPFFFFYKTFTILKIRMWRVCILYTS